MSSPDEWLRIEEVAEVPRFKMLPATTLRYLLQKGDAPPGVKIGGKWYWRACDIDSWLEGRMATSVQDRHHQRPQRPTAKAPVHRAGRPRKEVR